MIPSLAIPAFVAGALVLGTEASEFRCALPQRQLVFAQNPDTCPTTGLGQHEKENDQIHNSSSMAPYSSKWGWSNAPHCIRGRSKVYCAHTTAQFRDGGLSIIATPEAAQAATQAFPYANKAEKYDHEAYLEVRDIPGKGKGLVAKTALKKGTVIMYDAARIIASSQLPYNVKAEEGLSLFQTAVDKLPPKDRQLVLDLDKSSGGSGIDDILKTNSFACQFADGSEGDGEGYLCLFPLVSRINHACRPNSNAKFIQKTLLMEIKTLRNIAEGEEISISYGRVDLKHAERQKLYSEGWHFTCTCSMCTADKYTIAGSDQRRDRFELLRNKLKEITSETFDAQQIIAWEKEILELSEKEGLEVLIADDLERLAYVYSGLGKGSEAIMWAKRARKNILSWVYVEGGFNPELERVEQLLVELGG